MRILAYLFDLIVFVIIGRLLTLVINRLFGVGNRGQKSAPRPAAQASDGARHGETVRDPVCGIFVSTELSHRLKHDGQTLHFCSEECLERYQKEVVHA